MSKYNFLVPTLTEEKTKIAVEQLQISLDVLSDLSLTLKHAHWNVTGPNFIAVHEMLDPEIDDIRNSVDEIAERVATLGASPSGLCHKNNTPADSLIPIYPIEGRASSEKHLKAIDEQYTIIITGLRDAIDKLDDIDFVSSNIIQDVVGKMELFQWKVRSHLV